MQFAPRSISMGFLEDGGGEGVLGFWVFGGLGFFGGEGSGPFFFFLNFISIFQLPAEIPFQGTPASTREKLCSFIKGY